MRLDTEEVFNALRMFGVLSVPELVEKLALKGIETNAHDVRNALGQLMLAERVRESDIPKHYKIGRPL